MHYIFSKRLLLMIIVVFTLHFSAWAQKTDYFNSDVETLKKPWTDLEFYNNPSNFQFALVSDNTGGMRAGIFETAVDKLNLMMPEFVLSVGDLIEGYTQDTTQIRIEWEDFNSKVDQLRMPFFYLPGNHDITNHVMQKEWEERYGRRFYYFTYKDVLFIILDSNDDDDHNLTEDQTTFAIKALKAHPDARWTFVLMHHPIWKYDTGGRFERIEMELAQRKHTVLSGHEHHYQHIERNKSNYYVLGTTGGGSALRGNHFGEFDHIVWVTMLDEGPVMANLRLDGILEHDVSNEETAVMSRSMLQNTNFKFLMLTNPGNYFREGTGYLHFKNSAEVPLHVDLSFYHHHEVDLEPSAQSLIVPPGEEKYLEVSISSKEPLAFSELGFLKYYWKLSYKEERYKDFFLDGNTNFTIQRSTPDYFLPRTSKFMNTVDVTFEHPFPQLKANVVFAENSETGAQFEKFRLDKSTDLHVRLVNEKDQVTEIARKSYEKTYFKKGIKVKKTTPGLEYAYYEGEWTELPDFNSLEPLKTGVVTDFGVGDLAGGDKNNFGLRYTGFIEIPEDGLYHFRCRADDAAIMKIHGEVVNQDGTGSVDATTSQAGPIGAIALSKGFHPVVIDFMEVQGNERLRFYYRMSEQDRWTFMYLDDFFRVSGRKK